MTEKSIQNEWCALPESLRVFVPEIKRAMFDFSIASARADKGAYSAEQIRIVAENQNRAVDDLALRFEAAGGTDAQWNSLFRLVGYALDKKLEL